MKFWVLGAAALAASLASSAAGQDSAYVITLKDHVFSPAVLELPANTRVKVTLRNEDGTRAEFESNALNREKVLAPKSETTIYLGPLAPGSYSYYDDFHRDTARAGIEVK